VAKTIITTINKCSECLHSSHTGAFIKGGSKICCDHDLVCKSRGYDCFRRIIRNVDKIPGWCPL